MGNLASSDGGIVSVSIDPLEEDNNCNIPGEPLVVVHHCTDHGISQEELEEMEETTDKLAEMAISSQRGSNFTYG